MYHYNEQIFFFLANFERLKNLEIPLPIILLLEVIKLIQLKSLNFSSTIILKYPPHPVIIYHFICRANCWENLWFDYSLLILSFYRMFIFIIFFSCSISSAPVETLFNWEWNIDILRLDSTKPKSFHNVLSSLHPYLSLPHLSHVCFPF